MRNHNRQIYNAHLSFSLGADMPLNKSNKSKSKKKREKKMKQKQSTFNKRNISSFV